VLLSQGKPVVASSSTSSAVAPALAVDGLLSTRWASNASDPQWIYVDLGAKRTLRQVVVRWHAAYARSYKIQISNNATQWTNAATTTTGDGGVDYWPVTGSARYVRLVGTVRGTTQGYSVFELRVYGN
jgi:hypothetical protein